MPKVLLTRITKKKKQTKQNKTKQAISFYFMLNMNTSETTVIDWNKLDNNIRKSESESAFKKSLNLSDQFLICLMCINLMELNCLQD